MAFQSNTILVILYYSVRHKDCSKCFVVAQHDTASNHGFHAMPVDFVLAQVSQHSVVAETETC